jgi:hypothetical protein
VAKEEAVLHWLLGPGVAGQIEDADAQVDQGRVQSEMGMLELELSNPPGTGSIG